MWMATVVRQITDTYWNWEILKKQNQKWVAIPDSTSEGEANNLANILVDNWNGITEDERLHVKLVRIYKTH